MKNVQILTKVILVMISSLFIISCSKNEEPITYDLTGNWKVISFIDYKTSIKVTKTSENTWTQYNNGDITVSFTNSSLSNGVASGKNVTNSFSSDYVIDTKGGIVISNGIWTEINEPEWGRLFHAIELAETFEIKNGQLVIFYNQKNNSIILERN